MLEAVLTDFGVKGRITAVRPGPVVTLYEFEPAAGVKSIARDLAVRRRGALDERGGGAHRGDPRPQCDRHRAAQPDARDGLSCARCSPRSEYDKARAPLTLALGKTIGGEPVMADLAKMPHLLVAGTTGSGKSVGLNTMILSLLYRMPPEQCRLIMIDPKMLELSVYDGIPHLLVAGRDRSAQGRRRAEMGGARNGRALPQDVQARRARRRSLQRPRPQGQGQGREAQAHGADRLRPRDRQADL